MAEVENLQSLMMSTTSDERSTHEERYIILVGKTGNGKSSTGNSILGKTMFVSKRCLGSITQKCEVKSSFRTDVQRQYTVVDTPGLFDTDKPIAERALAVQNALEFCTKPHAFLIVLSTGRFSTDEKLTLDLLHVALGKDFVNHSIVVFTRGADFESDKEFNDFLTGNKHVMALIKKCGDRVLRIENSPHFDATIKNDLLNGLFIMIEKMCDGGLLYYQYESLSVHRRCLEKHIENQKEYADLGDELQQLAYDIVGEVTAERQRLEEEHLRKLKQEQEEMERQLEEKKRQLEAEKEEELRQQKLEHEAEQRKMEELNRQLEREKDEEIRKMLEEQKRKLEQEAKEHLKLEKQREMERQRSNEELRRQREMLHTVNERNRQMEENQRQERVELTRTMERMKEAMQDERRLREWDSKLKEKEMEMKMAELRLETESNARCAVM